MTGHELALSLAYIGATLGVAMVVPQILRTLRNPSLGGVSPVAWSLTTLACLGWLTYGIRTDSVPQIPGNVLLVSGAVAIVLLVPSRVSVRARALRLGGAAAALLLVASVVPAHWVGYLAFAVGLGSGWPQIVESVANWRTGSTSGVSVASWSLRVLSQLCWLTYAISVSDVPVTIAATVALTTAVLLVLLELSARSQESRSQAALEVA